MPAVDDAHGVDDAGGELAYECSEWSEESRRLLDGLLDSSGVPRVWQGTTLTVRSADGAVVDRLVDEVVDLAEATARSEDGVDDLGGFGDEGFDDEPDEGDDEEDGPATHELLDRLFDAAGRLARRPGDAAAAGVVDDLVPVLAGRRPPYGIGRDQWRGLIAPAERLHRSLGAADPDGPVEGGGPDGAEDEVASVAAGLRDQLRDWL